MATLHLLGTGAGLSDPERTTTMLAFTDDTNTVVVDCGGDLVQRLMASGIRLDTIQSLIITHEHPDHCSGFPLFMEKIWLSGRRHPLDVYGNHAAIAQVQRAFDAFNLANWTAMPQLIFHEISLTENAPVLTDEVWDITACPVLHPVPTCGLRVCHRPSGRIVAYSCDTAFSETVVRMASKDRKSVV